MKKKRLVVTLTLVMVAIAMAVFFISRSSDTPVKQVTQQPTELPAATPENLLAETNKQRTLAGVPALTIDERLNQSALLKCQEMVKDNYYAHQDPITGKHGYEYISELVANVQAHAENLNKGFFNDAYTVVSDPVYGWMGSQAHREAMLSTDYKQVGFASCYISTGNAGSIGGTKFFVQHLASIP